MEDDSSMDFNVQFKWRRSKKAEKPKKVESNLKAWIALLGCIVPITKFIIWVLPYAKRLLEQVNDRNAPAVDY